MTADIFHVLLVWLPFAVKEGRTNWRYLSFFFKEYGK
jgi:hypothetical protein